MNNKDVSTQILSDVTVFNKYAKYLPELQRRETWEEICVRNMNMHIAKYPQLTNEIKDVYERFVLPKKVLPSMRSMQFGGRPIELSNNRIFNCFSADTKFLSNLGVVSFNQLTENQELLVPTHTGEWKSAVVKKYGRQNINKIVFRRGKTLKTVKATPNHRWLLKNGDETTNLSVGMALISTPTLFDFEYTSATPEQRLYWAYGYVFGDGTLIKDKDGNTKYSMVRLCGEKELKYKNRFEELGFKTSSPHSCGGDFFAYTGTYLKTVPALTIDSIDLIKAFIAGYCDADAYKNPNWYKDNTRSKYLSIQSSNEDHCKFIESAFEIAGQYIQTEFDLTNEKTNFGVRGFTKKYSISSNLQQQNLNWLVESIEPLGEEDVWCLEVEDNHSFILSGGIVTGNCAYMAANDPAVFSEAMFLLLGGTGLGYSVQARHVSELPVVQGPKQRTRRFLVGDSIEGWADAIKVLVEAYFFNKAEPIFDYRDIRPKGAKLITSGGKAPGPEPLRICVEQLRSMLANAVGRKLKPIEVHDMLCHIADAVLSGGIRRAALISLFDIDDKDMLSSKMGAWYETEPQRGRANNSVVLHRNYVTREHFDAIWKAVRLSGSGEPGIFWTNDYEYGTNPCAEIALVDMQFCNLTEINVSDVETQEDLNARSRAAAFLGTLQAGYTDFHYLRPEWRENTEREALIGVGQTGIGSGTVLPLNLEEASTIVARENERVASLIGINVAARTTTVKPSGTSSLTVGSSSGIHGWFDPFYIRRMRVGKNEALYQYMLINFPELVEDCMFKPHLEAVLSFPQRAPTGAILRHEKALDTLERVKKYNQEWVRTGHRYGQNYHNVSCTVSIKEEEWDEVGNWMWENREFYTGISVLPYDGGTYVQAPFETITEEKFNELSKFLHAIDLTQVIEVEDNTELNDQVACLAGACLV